MPDVSTEYVPTLATVIVEPAPTVQFGACSAGLLFGLQSFTEAGLRLMPVALSGAESLESKFFVCATFFGPEEVSGAAMGSGAPWHIAPSLGPYV